MNGYLDLAGNVLISRAVGLLSMCTNSVPMNSGLNPWFHGGTLRTLRKRMRTTHLVPRIKKRRVDPSLFPVNRADELQRVVRYL